jgi:hypothetical protein
MPRPNLEPMIELALEVLRALERCEESIAMGAAPDARVLGTDVLVALGTLLAPDQIDQLCESVHCMDGDCYRVLDHGQHHQLCVMCQMVKTRESLGHIGECLALEEV